MQETNTPEVKPPVNTPPKRPIGFLGYLWRIFVFFLIVLLLFTGFFFWQRPQVTGWFLTLYSMRLSAVLVSGDYYTLTDDPSYNQQLPEEQKKTEFLLANFDKQFRKSKQKELQECFQVLLDAYAKNPNQDWTTTFHQLGTNIEQILQDNKVTLQEIADLKIKVSDLAKERSK